MKDLFKHCREKIPAKVLSFLYVASLITVGITLVVDVILFALLIIGLIKFQSFLTVVDASKYLGIPGLVIFWVAWLCIREKYDSYLRTPISHIKRQKLNLPENTAKINS
jgi:hypothetical protein